MKKDIHPTYREVVFQDISTDFSFLTRSTISTKETVQWTDGKTYPLVKVEVSSHTRTRSTPANKKSWTPPAAWIASAASTGCPELSRPRHPKASLAMPFLLPPLQAHGFCGNAAFWGMITPF